MDIFASYYNIYLIYINNISIMRKIKKQTEITIKGVVGFLIKKVTPFGTGAKVDCPKEFLGKEVYLVIKE